VAAAYAERGYSGLSREAAAIWRDEPAAAMPPEPDPGPFPPRLNGKRCKTCQYRSDALGHAKTCGVSA